MIRLYFLLFLFLPLSYLNSQVTINVPGDYTTIQAAINAANNGDLVLVAEGTYQENINFRGKAITVASHFIQDGETSHINNTIIDGSQPSNPDSGSVVLFKSGEDTTSVLMGFTIKNGTGSMGTTARGGGGIAVYESGALICNNKIESNSLNFSISYGAGVYILSNAENTTVLRYNIIKNNSSNASSFAYGGGIYSPLGNAGKIIITSNIISNNSCIGTDYSAGGGIKISTSGTGYALISNNRIEENTISAGISATGGGIECFGPIGEIDIISNIIKSNTVQSNNSKGGGIDVYECEPNTPVIKNNVIVDNYSSRYGGGVYVDLVLDNSFKPELNQHTGSNSFGDNLAEQFLTNNTLYNNSAGVSGGGIYTYDMTTNIMNSIIWGNTAPSNPQIAGNVDVNYSDVEGGWVGNGNIDELPLFNMESEFYHLWDTSLCVDAGNPDPQYNDVEDPDNTGYAMEPAWGTLRNDIGHCGGPSSRWCYWEWPIPVELTSFTATLENRNVSLNWSTASETNNLGFEVERNITSDKNADEWEKVGFVRGHGTTTNVQSYFYPDDISDISSSTVVYRLKQIDFNGSYSYSGEVSVNNQLPVNFTLQQNYPNPFNPVTTIHYSLPVESRVELTVFNMLGEKIFHLVNQNQEAGNYSVKFNAENLSSGVYLYRLKAGDPSTGSGQVFIQTKKMMIIK